MKFHLFTITFLSFLTITLNAQDDLLQMLEEEVTQENSSEKVIATFKGKKLINANTIETTKKKTLDFNITHRFGDMLIGKADGHHTMWGLDNATNIRFSLDYGITDKLSVGVGRSKTQEHIDGNIKYRFLEQKQNGIPLSAAYYTNMAFSAIANIPGDELANRFSYTHQLIVASKISPSISLQILPTLVHRNFVYKKAVHPKNNATDDHSLFALGFAGRFKFTKRAAFVIDYFLPFSNYRASGNGYYNALGLGIEIETGGHVFLVNFTNSAGIIENDFLPHTRSSWADGQYKLGFNISRVFSF